MWVLRRIRSLAEMGGQFAMTPLMQTRPSDEGNHIWGQGILSKLRTTAFSVLPLMPLSSNSGSRRVYQRKHPARGSIDH